MEPQLIGIEIPRIDSVYPVAALVGISLGIASQRCLYSPSILPQKLRWECIVLVGLAAVIGAYSIGPISILWGTELYDGRSMLSALLGGWLGAEVIKKYLRITRSIGDEFALPLAVAFTAGRIGCIFSHCCDGAPISAHIVFTYHGQPFFPTGVYEALFHSFWAVLLLYLNRKGALVGQHLRVYLASYCIFRFITEYWRGNPTNHFGLSVYQGLSVLLLCVIVGTVLLERRAQRRQVCVHSC